MITCIVGFPGSGKTTDAARRAHYYLKKGVKVYSNIPELTETIPVSIKDLGVFSIHDGVLIFDEAGVFRYRNEFEKLQKLSNGGDLVPQASPA